jgi:aspartokinase
MLEMASLGSKVLQIRAVEFANKHNVTLRVLHSFEKGSGTLITLGGQDEMEQSAVSGIACRMGTHTDSDNRYLANPIIATKLTSAQFIRHLADHIQRLLEVIPMHRGINIQIISTSEIKVSVVIAEKYLELAVRALHSAFELDKVPALEGA